MVATKVQRMTTQTAPTALSLWLLARGRTRELAALLGVQPSTVWRWRTGRSRPSGAARIVIEQHVGVPRELWAVSR